MTWVKVDALFFTHPKAIAAGPNGRALYLAALCWSKAHLTDGVIPRTALRTLHDQAGTPNRQRLDIEATLVAVGMMHDAVTYLVIHDYHDWQESADTEKRRKAAHAATMRRRRAASDPPRDLSPNGHKPVTPTMRDMSRDTDVTVADIDIDKDKDKEPSPPSVKNTRSRVRRSGGGDGEPISIASILGGTA